MNILVLIGVVLATGSVAAGRWVAGIVGSFSSASVTSSINRREEDQVDDEKKRTQYQGDTQSGLIGPEKAQSSAETISGRVLFGRGRGRRVSNRVVADADDADATAAISRRSHRRSRFGRHHVRVDQSPIWLTCCNATKLSQSIGYYSDLSFI